MYWNKSAATGQPPAWMINYNMRCIETASHQDRTATNDDKLQHEMYWNYREIKPFKSHSFDKLQHEMYWNYTCTSVKNNRIKINYNMRCIETTLSEISEVLMIDKLQHEMYWNNIDTTSLYGISSINYNMRCIETILYLG